MAVGCGQCNWAPACCERQHRGGHQVGELVHLPYTFYLFFLQRHILYQRVETHVLFLSQTDLNQGACSTHSSSSSDRVDEQSTCRIRPFPCTLYHHWIHPCEKRTGGNRPSHWQKPSFEKRSRPRARGGESDNDPGESRQTVLHCCLCCRPL